MGYDINIFVEVSKGDKWITTNTMSPFAGLGSETEFWPPALAQNYARFGKLASVKGEGLTPLGIPGDVSETTKYYWERYGGHFPSHLDIELASQIFLETETDATPDEITKFIRPDPASFYFGFFEPTEGGRIVFWF